MAAACKTTKPDLVAIYRLEFYKKQKNWKFCTIERKKEEERKKAAKNAKARLNQTYSIETAPERDKDTDNQEREEVKLADVESVQPEAPKLDVESGSAEEVLDDLNEAFVDTETDDNSPTTEPPTGPYSPKWSVQQWAARCRAWSCEPLCPDPQLVPSAPEQDRVWNDPNPYVTREQIPYYDQEQAVLQAFTDYEANLLIKRKHLAGSDMDVPHGAMLDMGNSRDREPHWGCRGEEGWPRHSQVWTNQHEGWFQEISDIPEEAIQALEVAEAGASADAVDCAGAELALLERADDWLGSSASLDKVAIYRSDSLPSVSSGSFSRGAALAAHSTQLELSAEAEAGAGAGAGAGSLSAAALATAVAGHAAALRALLGEARRRHLQVPPPPADLYSFDEYPTRDVGPARPPLAHSPSSSSIYTHNPTVVDDVFVAGSYKNRPDLCGHTERVGRGRGRNIKIVGVEMGRPYRL